jgi:hypothetical protein
MPRSGSLPFKILSAIVCDDVRQEKNNKFILIGVYVDKILPSQFPGLIAPMLWLQFSPTRVGEFSGSVRVRYGKKVAAEGLIKIAVKKLGVSSITLGNIPVQLHEPGLLEFQMQFEGGWKTIKTVAVVPPDSSP